MSTEESPLLGTPPSEADLQHELVYTRFTPAHKRFIVLLVSLAGLIPCTSLRQVQLKPQNRE